MPKTRPINGIGVNYDIKYDGSSDLGYNISAPGTLYAGGTGSELAYMFYVNLEGRGYRDINGDGPQLSSLVSYKRGIFSFSGDYFAFWSDEYTPNADHAWMFHFFFGEQSYYKQEF